MRLLPLLLTVITYVIAKHTVKSGLRCIYIILSEIMAILCYDNEYWAPRSKSGFCILRDYFILCAGVPTKNDIVGSWHYF